jgi:hypothetical protein
MRDSFARLVLLLAALAPASTAAMSAPGPTPLGGCHVIGGEKLPAASGGSRALCAEVERAIARLAPTVQYRAEIKVLSPSRLAAGLVVNGRDLPEQKFAIMDSDLNPGAIQRFAHSLATEIAKAAKP